MGTTETYLPPTFSEDSIIQLTTSLDLPAPTRVSPLQERAAFHSIYLIHFEPNDSTKIPACTEPDGSIDLILRVSGRQLPRIKTLNEVGVMAWVRENTSIPTLM